MGVPNQFVSKTIIESVKVNQNFAVACFSGEIRMYGSDTAPLGWLLCDGMSYLRADYADLFVIIGTKFGSVDGTHFNVPNMKGRVAVGQDLADATFQNIGNSGGAKIHTLSTSELPSHYHNVDPPNTWTSWADLQGDFSFHGSGSATALQGVGGVVSAGVLRTKYHSNSSSSGANSYDGAHVNVSHNHTLDVGAFNSGSEGGGGSHNNLQPYLVLNYIIKT